MQLIFESIGELSEFLEFSQRMGDLIARAAAVPAEMLSRGEPTSDAGDYAEEERKQGNVPAPAGELAAGATTGLTESAADTAASEAPQCANPLQATHETDSNDSQASSSAPTKRKRRTKAEMEAARAVEASTGNSSETDSSNVAAGSNPFEASTSNPSTATQAILSAPSGQAATLAGIQAMQTSPFDSASAAESPNPSKDSVVGVENSPTSSPTDVASFIETRSLEILSTQTEPLTAVKHMHLCRDFIAKHGQAKYLEGFALAGLPATIGTYKPEQCAKHQAALEFLNLNA